MSINQLHPYDYLLTDHRGVVLASSSYFPDLLALAAIHLPMFDNIVPMPQGGYVVRNGDDAVGYLGGDLPEIQGVTIAFDPVQETQS